jgi:hypothetical protein
MYSCATWVLRLKGIERCIFRQGRPDKKEGQEGSAKKVNTLIVTAPHRYAPELCFLSQPGDLRSPLGGWNNDNGHQPDWGPKNKCSACPWAPGKLPQSITFRAVMLS